MAVELDIQADPEEEIERLRKRIEEVERWGGGSAHEAEHRYRKLLDSLPDGVVVHTECRYVFANSAALELFGAEREEELIGRSIYDFVHPESGEMVANRVQTITERGADVPLVAQRIINLRGKVVDVEVVGAPLLFAGKPSVQAVLRDVTARNLVEDAAAKREKMARLYLERSPLPIVACDTEFITDFINEKFTGTFGYTVDDIPTMADWWNLACPDPGYRQEKESAWRARIEAAHRSGGEMEPMELKVVCRDGSERWVEALGMLVGDRVMVLLRDLTEHRALEERLLQSQKMESIGTLAGGIAHDFNNIMTAIIGYATLLSMKMEKRNPLQELVRKVIASANRGASLTTRLLSFSRQKTPSRSHIDLNKMIDNLNDLLRPTIGEDVVLKTVLAREPLITAGDRGQLEQVVMNLVGNARDAMPSGGAITISTSRTVGLLSDPAEIAGAPCASIRIKDTGCGIQPEAVSRIFEPFFTTKEAGKGTGLGLFMAYGTIRNHGGSISVDSLPGRGTTFVIRLPLADEVPAEVRKQQSTFVRGAETILLVEDDPDVADINRIILEEAGYTVLLARDGCEGVAIFEREHRKVSLVLLDVIMPGMNGVETRAAIREIDPWVNVLFMSGYTADVLSRLHVDAEKHFLSKPVAPDVLLEKVAEVVGSRKVRR